MNQNEQFILKNKIEDWFEDIKINLISDLRKCWIAWKYLIDVEIKKLDKKIEKEYICSIVKKEKNWTHLYLTHLDFEEINNIFKKA